MTRPASRLPRPPRRSLGSTRGLTTSVRSSVASAVASASARFGTHSAVLQFPNPLVPLLVELAVVGHDHGEPDPRRDAERLFVVPRTIDLDEVRIERLPLVRAVPILGDDARDAAEDDVPLPWLDRATRRSPPGASSVASATPPDGLVGHQTLRLGEVLLIVGLRPERRCPADRVKLSPQVGVERPLVERPLPRSTVLDRHGRRSALERLPIVCAAEMTGGDGVEEVLSAGAAQQHFRGPAGLGRVDVPDDVGKQLEALQLVGAWRRLPFDPGAQRSAVHADGPSDLLSGEARAPGDFVPELLDVLAHRAGRACVRNARLGRADVRLPELLAPADGRARHPLGSEQEVVEVLGRRTACRAASSSRLPLEERICKRQDRPRSENVGIVMSRRTVSHAPAGSSLSSELVEEGIA